MKHDKKNTRGKFIKTLAAGTAGAGLVMAMPEFARGGLIGGKAAPNEKFVVGIMGVNSRGKALARGFARLPEAEVAYICDVDQRAIDKAISDVGEHQEIAPKGVKDFRRILDDQDVDALVVATPDHWHAPAAILACQAGKHVYVEKPCGHNPKEGELLVETARKHNRVVQMGNQRRSWPKTVEGIEKVRKGAIGKVYYSRGWYASGRGSIGIGKKAPVPDWLDFELWQGPAPRRPFKDNIVHYNWHWFWHWGTGEAGNNGIHALDLCRWGLGVDYPIRVTSTGGRYYWNDDQETPDTHLLTFEFDGGKTIAWESLSCNLHGILGGFGASFHGTDGTIVLTKTGYIHYDREDKVVASVFESDATVDRTGPGFDYDAGHLRNFLDCIRDRKRPRSDIEGGHKSTLLCHLGNIAHRVGRSLYCDPKNGHILKDRQAAKFWSREYEKGWAPQV